MSSNSPIRRQYGMVELPCFVNSMEKGLNLIGGLDRVKKVFQADSSSSSNLKLNFSSGDPLRKGISSEKVLSPGIVVRLRKKRANKTCKDDDENVAFEVLGFTKHLVCFRSPADFQVKICIIHS